MDILGIGGWEFVLVILLVLILFSPKDLQKAGKTIGQNLNKLVHSDTWRTVVQTSKELRQLPNKLMREANLDEMTQTVKQLKDDVNPRIASKDLFPEWTSPMAPDKPAAEEGQSQTNTIAPPDGESKSSE